jgi:hypothetical protein
MKPWCPSVLCRSLERALPLIHLHAGEGGNVVDEARRPKWSMVSMVRSRTSTGTQSVSITALGSARRLDGACLCLTEGRHGDGIRRGRRGDCGEAEDASRGGRGMGRLELELERKEEGGRSSMHGVSHKSGEELPG